MKPQYFDAHTHVNFVAYKDDRAETVKRALDDNVWMCVIGTQLDTSKSALELAKKYNEGVYATIGLHPVHTKESYLDPKEIGGDKGIKTRSEAFDKDAYREIAQDEKVVAIGECGLDYFRMEEDTKKVQSENFIKQIELANEVNKPLMIHVRDAYEDTISILKEYAKVPSNIHFFAGNWEIAKKFLDLGSTLSFTGVLTFTNDYDEVVKNIPMDRIMSETDAPYVSPVPYRGKRNEPLYVKETVKRIAQIRGEDFEEVRGKLVDNAIEFFNIRS